jgi:hypothetical protein
MRFKMLGAITLGGLLATAAAQATTYATLSLEELTAQAPVAVLAEVTSAPDTVTGDGSYRLATVTVQTALWGTNADTLQVALPGGRQSFGKLSVVSVMPGAPELFVGSRVVLLLKPHSTGAGLEVVGFNQGVFTVSPSGAVMLPGATAPLSLQQAMQTIREVRTAPLSQPALLEQR